MTPPAKHRRPSDPRRSPPAKPPLTLQTTTLWAYPSQHYDEFILPDGTRHRSRSRPSASGWAMQGDQTYVGATPSWVIWQCVVRFCPEGGTVLDPMCGSGTTLDVCADLGRHCLAFDLAPRRPDIHRADARRLPVQAESVDLAFVDPPYSTHVRYSDDPRCIGRLDAAGEDGGRAYYRAMGEVFERLHTALRPGGVLAVYVSDSFRITQRAGRRVFMPIGFTLFSMLAVVMEPIDLICVVRHNQKLQRGHWHKAAAERGFFLRGFNYVLLFRKNPVPSAPGPTPRRQ